MSGDAPLPEDGSPARVPDHAPSPDATPAIVSSIHAPSGGVEGDAERSGAYQAAHRTSPAGYVFLLGVVLFLIGFAWYKVEPDAGKVTQAWIFASVLLMLAPVAWHIVDIFHSVATKRGGAFASVVLTVGLGGVVMVAVSALNIRMKTEWGASWTLDLTESGRYTLGEETRKILGEVEKKGTVYATYLERPSERSRTSPALRKMAEDQLQVYAYASGGSVVVRQFDDFREGAKVKDWLLAHGVSSTSAGEDVDVIVFSYAEKGREAVQGKQKELPVEEFAFAKVSSADGSTRWLGERAITGAIQELVFTRLKAYAVGGHGESGLTDEMRNLRDRLVAMNVEVVDKPWRPSETPQVPDDCDLLLLLGPRQPLPPEHADAIARWLDKGRTLFLSVDVDETGTRRETGLEKALAQYGIETRINYAVVAPFLTPVPTGGVIVEPRTDLVISGPSYGNHPSVAPLKRGTGFTTVFRLSSFLELETEPPAGVTVDPVVWAPDPGHKDIFRPYAARITPQRRNITTMNPDEDKHDVRLALAAVASRELPADASGTKRDARVIALADTDCIADTVTNQNLPNLDLAGNLIQWGLRREELVAVSDKTLDSELADITDREHRMGFWWPLVPALTALVLGAAVWWSRRR